MRASASRCARDHASLLLAASNSNVDAKCTRPAGVISRARVVVMRVAHGALPVWVRRGAGAPAGIPARRVFRSGARTRPCGASSVGSVTPSSAAAVRASPGTADSISASRQASAHSQTSVAAGRAWMKSSSTQVTARQCGERTASPAARRRGRGPELATIRGLGHAQEVRRAPGDAAREPVGREDQILGQPLADRRERRAVPTRGRPRSRGRGPSGASPRRPRCSGRVRCAPRSERWRPAAAAGSRGEPAVAGRAGGPAGPRRPPPPPRRTAPR